MASTINRHRIWRVEDESASRPGSNLPEKTFGDYLAIAICPLLIIALVGSLVFFLLEVLYVGKYEPRLKWILFLFVMGAVMIARVSMTGEIAERAKLYGLALAIAVALALNTFLKYPGGGPLAEFGWLINLALIAIIWWCAHKLTWDCTFIDDNTDASGVGLLQVAGLDKRAEPQAANGAASGGRQPPVPGNGNGDETGGSRPPLAASSIPPKLDAKRKPHAPGVWIIYFSIAALPLFGLGQLLVPVSQGERRREIFWLLCIYLSSGLGLLLATSFLGLRRYLRQRKLQMPAAMTGVWLGFGALLIACLLGFSIFLPRPNAELDPTGVSKILGSKDRKASKHAMMKDSYGEGKGKASKEGPQDQKATGDGGAKKDPSSKNTTQGKTGQGNKGDQASNSGNKQGNKSGKQGDKQGNKDGSQGKTGEKSQGDEEKKKDENSSGLGDENPDDGEGEESDRTSDESQSEWTGTVATVLKWIVYIILGLIALYLLIRFLANFTTWAGGLLDALSAFWRRLFGRKDKPASEKSGVTEEPVEERVPPPPFSAYADPYLTGLADRVSPEELVRYTFDALEAWANDYRFGRRIDETPIEFAERLSSTVPSLDPSADRLAGLYARVAYARGPLGADVEEIVRGLWERLVPAASGAALGPALSR